MQKTKTLLALAGAAMLCSFQVAHAQTAAMRDNAVTVESLIQAENDQIRKANNPTKPAAEIAASRAAATAAKNRRAEVVVRRIGGVGDSLTATILIDGIQFNNVQAGKTVGNCVVSRIENKVVTLMPKDKKVNPNLCPQGVWTGFVPMAEMPPGPAAASGGSAPLPPGMPMPSGAPR